MNQDDGNPLDNPAYRPLPELPRPPERLTSPAPEEDPLAALSKFEEPAPRRFLRPGAIVEILTVCCLALVLALFLRVFVAQAYEIRGHSMEPTLHDGERVMMTRLKSLQPGDLIIFKSPRDRNKDLVKRVIAMPGDYIHIEGNRVWVNGKLLHEAYILRDAGSSDLPDISRIVPDGYIYVLGDNRPKSLDSRSFGPVPLTSVKGEVVMCFWPIDEFRTFP